MNLKRILWFALFCAQSTGWADAIQPPKDLTLQNNAFRWVTFKFDSSPCSNQMTDGIIGPGVKSTISASALQHHCKTQCELNLYFSRYCAEETKVFTLKIMARKGIQTHQAYNWNYYLMSGLPDRFQASIQSVNGPKPAPHRDSLQSFLLEG